MVKYVVTHPTCSTQLILTITAYKVSEHVPQNKPKILVQLSNLYDWPLLLHYAGCMCFIVCPSSAQQIRLIVKIMWSNSINLAQYSTRSLKLAGGIMNEILPLFVYCVHWFYYTVVLTRSPVAASFEWVGMWAKATRPVTTEIYDYSIRVNLGLHIFTKLT